MIDKSGGNSYREVMIEKVWYGDLVGEKCFRIRRVPFFFLKKIEQLKSVYDENMIFGGFVGVGQLRRWARVYLWLKEISLIKVW